MISKRTIFEIHRLKDLGWASYLKGVALNDRSRWLGGDRKGPPFAPRLNRFHNTVSTFQGLTLEASKRESNEKVVETVSVNKVGRSPCTAYCLQEMEHQRRDVRIAITAPKDRSRTVAGICVGQSSHNGLIPPTVPAYDCRVVSEVRYKGFTKLTLLPLNLAQCVLQSVIPIVAMHGYAEQFALAS